MHSPPELQFHNPISRAVSGTAAAATLLLNCTDMSIKASGKGLKEPTGCCNCTEPTR